MNRRDLVKRLAAAGLTAATVDLQRFYPLDRTMLARGPLVRKGMIFKAYLYEDGRSGVILADWNSRDGYEPSSRPALVQPTVTDWRDGTYSVGWGIVEELAWQGSLA